MTSSNETVRVPRRARDAIEVVGDRVPSAVDVLASNEDGIDAVVGGHRHDVAAVHGGEVSRNHGDRRSAGKALEHGPHPAMPLTEVHVVADLPHLSGGIDLDHPVAADVVPLAVETESVDALQPRAVRFVARSDDVPLHLVGPGEDVRKQCDHRVTAVCGRVRNVLPAGLRAQAATDQSKVA